MMPIPFTKIKFIKKLTTTDSTALNFNIKTKINNQLDKNATNLRQFYQMNRNKRLAQPRIIGGQSATNLNGFITTSKIGFYL